MSVRCVYTYSKGISLAQLRMVAPNLDGAPLTRLPCELIGLSLGDLSAVRALACTCRHLKHVCKAEAVWQRQFRLRFGPVVERWFDASTLATPREGVSWRSFFADFDAHWPAWAYKASGKILLRLHGRLYDVTDFVHVHPGGAFFSAEHMREARGRDISQAFDMVGHSSSAKRLLATLRVQPPVGSKAWPMCEGQPESTPPEAAIQSLWSGWAGRATSVVRSCLLFDSSAGGNSPLEYRQRLHALVSLAPPHPKAPLSAPAGSRYVGTRLEITLGKAALESISCWMLTGVCVAGAYCAAWDDS